MALSTDMIVGFPGETDADFEETLSLTEAVGYHSMFSFKYSPRPNTLADQRLPDDVPEAEKTRRIVALQALQREIQSALNARLVGPGGRRAGRRGEPAARDRDFRGGRRTNVVVNLPGPPEWIGRTVRTRIERAGPHSVWGQATADDAAGDGVEG